MKSLCVFILILAAAQGRKEKYEKLIASVANNPFIKEGFERNLKIFGGEQDTTEFPCEPLAPSATVPTSVHKLRPSDIKVVAALGDSLTAGNGVRAKTILGVLREDRDLAFSIGGDGTFEEQITIPNILKKYNPSITGFSTRHGGINNRGSKLNVADPGNVVSDMLEEANMLVARMKADTNIDINNDWKLITILIGDNDLCDVCEDNGPSGDKYIATLERAITILQNNLPRTIVNVVEVLNAFMVKDLNKGLICKVVHFFLCKCAAYPKDAEAEARLTNMTRIFQTRLHDLAASGKFDTKDDFTVVDQPFFRETYLPTKPDSSEADLSYFAPDCFHLSRKGQATAARALWNGMFQPVGQKKLHWDIGSSLICPTENDGSDFPCSPIPPSPTVPTSAHKVRPGDIKIVAALGDSLTAGMGITAKTILSLLTEDRGLAFSIGGDGSFEEHITLPNILKKYNPTITGYAIKTGDVSDANARFDVAESGNVFTDLNDEANLLIKRMQADINIDINNDWKLITILIGDNDLCKFCNEDGHEGERYVAELEKTLKNLQDNLPRTIVNLMEVLNIEIVKDLNKGILCSVLHYTVCTCAAFPKSEKDETELKKLTRTYQDYVQNMTTSGKFDNKEDFTVVDQPFFRETYLPYKSGSSDIDYSYFAPDCFHLSEKGHETAATALWNNMFQPVGKKDKNWGIGKPVSCPTEQQPYIFTNKNSGSLHKSNLSAFP